MHRAGGHWGVRNGKMCRFKSMRGYFRLSLFPCRIRAAYVGNWACVLLLPDLARVMFFFFPRNCKTHSVVPEVAANSQRWTPHGKTTGCLRALQSEPRGSSRSHSVSDAAAASDLFIMSARRGARCKCTTKKTRISLSHVAVKCWISAAVRQNFSLEERSKCPAAVYGVQRHQRAAGAPPWVSDGPQEQRIISKIAEGALCCCVQSMANQEAGRQAGSPLYQTRGGLEECTTLGQECQTLIHCGDKV